jgi:hypothetical protein
VTQPRATIYYPVDWLTAGGPPIEDWCPKADQEQIKQVVGIALAPDCETWRVISGEHILMETKVKTDVMKYFFEYMMAIECYIMESK